MFPPINSTAQQSVDHRYHRGTHDQRKDWAVRLVVDELDGVGDARTERREKNPTTRRVGRGFWIGDHEKGENQQCTVLQLVQGNSEWIVQPDCPGEEHCPIDGDKRDGRFGPPGTGKNKKAETGEDKSADGSATPLPG